LDLGGSAPIVRTVADNLPVALFEVLQQLPMPTIASGLATLLVITFFVTSADSGALVIDMITSGAAPNPPVWQRIFWAVCAGVVAAVLLIAGGLKALQTAALASALPFAVIMLFICYGLLRALQTETAGSAIDLSMAADAPPVEARMGWQQRLASITHSYTKKEIASFMHGTAVPALNAVTRQMRASGLAPQFTQNDDRLDLTVPHDNPGVFRYTIRARSFRAPSFAWAETTATDPAHRHYRAMAYSSEGDQPHDVTGYTYDQLINDFLNRYARFRHARRLS
ncbi:MAG TPA: BCCT family transporter, partial [Noviherbaspirillum sp.]|uniref:BCCT family transporter n=1 Tax=Noviherbaspirillum sp. TaxID=1926288 RepID=UPI002DDCDCA0